MQGGSGSAARIHVAFRFHGNFYHSFRGDTPDELGFGKDIRVIRRVIEVLDEFNARGVPVRGTWDFENYFSFETIMPRHCPDIIESMQRRVKSGLDEIQIMSYNNGLVSASTAREFDEAIARAISNPQGSGVCDLFGDFAPMVRPQEMMFTPSHLALYPRHGIRYISLFYSAIPFNGFSNFVPELSLAERYNPLEFSVPGVEGSMVLVPAYNPGDLLDNISLRRWVKRLREMQRAMEEPTDLLLIIDMDADDQFWCGISVPVVSRLYSMGQGLKGLVESILDLEYVTFTTPCEYLKNHPPVGKLSFGQDTADGSFDGISSWAEKWENQEIWTGLERSRLLELQALRLLEDSGASGRRVGELLAESFEERLRLLSTTHFGMAAPVMNLTRLRTAASLTSRSVDLARNGFEVAAASLGADGSDCLLFDYPRGVSTGTVRYKASPSRSMLGLKLGAGFKNPVGVELVDTGGRSVPAAVLERDGGSELYAVVHLDANERRDFKLVARSGVTKAPNHPVCIDTGGIKNGRIALRYDTSGNVLGLEHDGEDVLRDGGMSTAIGYNGKRREPGLWKMAESLTIGEDRFGFVRMKGEIELPGVNARAVVEREFVLAADLPYLYVRMTMQYPSTPMKGFEKGKAARLQQKWDARWEEIIPCEIAPSISGSAGSPLKVWKHNYFGQMSSYHLDYGDFSGNRELDSCNNHVTNAWVAVSNGQKGMLVAQTASVSASMAFCPLRTRRVQNNLWVYLNPFGSYWGEQYSYHTAYTGIGAFVAKRFSASDHILPYAPSFNGRRQSFEIMLAPYRGDAPPEDIRADASAFAYPPCVLSPSGIIEEPSYRRWAFAD